MLEKKINEVRKQVLEWKKKGLKVGLVPTMGALHEGHFSLIKKSVEICDKTIVSIFVNPIQFGPSEDLQTYPRTLEKDLQLCKIAGVNIVFAPNPVEMYGGKCDSAFSNSLSPIEEESRREELPRLSNDFLTYVVPPFFYTNKLCAKTRTGHFEGVCTVVNKLFNIIQPDYAFFGQKDFQQQVIIRKMVKDLNIPVEIVSCPIVRDENGLALSSRNKYLSDEGRKEALVLSKILSNIKECYKQGITDANALSETAFSFLNEHHELEYLEFVDKDNLENKTVVDDNTVVLTAIQVDKVRLIDNCFIKQ